MEIAVVQIRDMLFAGRRYFLDGADQGTIAAEMNVSRPTVSRLLHRARELGIVRIEVSHPIERTTALETALAEAFDLRYAWVAEPEPEQDRLSAVAARAAAVLPDLIGRDSVVAISNGTTLAAVVEAMSAHPRRDSTVVQMIGSLGADNQLIDGPELCRRLADLLGGAYRAMPAPLVTRSAHLASALRRESTVFTTLALAARADLAIVGIGTVDESGSGHIFDGWMTPAISRELSTSGAVGHIYGHHFDAAGRHLPSQLCNRTVNVPLDRIPQIPLVIGVVTGQAKTAAALGALRGRHVNALVTDSALAESLLKRASTTG